MEVDGLRYHRTPLEQRRDLERAHALRKSGHELCRFTYWQVAKEPWYPEEMLRAVRPARRPDRPRVP